MRKITNWHCVICNHHSKTPAEWELHITSEKHVEDVKKYKPIMPVEIPPPNTNAPQVTPIQPAQPQTSQSTHSNIPPLLPPKELMDLTAKFQDDLNQEALRQIVAKDKKDWKCVNCNIICQSPCSWAAHLASIKHRKNKHKFHTFPGITKESVKKGYQKNFVRAAETFGNEFIEDGVVFYCKRCDVRMQTKLQLEVHMSSNLHKMNYPIAPPRAPNPYPVENNQQLFNFESSSYGYGFRNWTGEQHLANRNIPPPSMAEMQQQQAMDRERQLVEKAKNELLARFPFYAINSQNEASSHQYDNIPLPQPQPAEAPMPVEPPQMDQFLQQSGNQQSNFNDGWFSSDNFF